MALLRWPVTIYRLLVIIVVSLLMIVVSSFFFLLGKSVDWGHHNLRRIWSGLILKLCFIRAEVCAMQRLPENMVCIFLSNHKSEYDWYMFTHFVPFNWRAVIRADLRNYSFAGPMAARLEQVFLTPGGGATHMLEQVEPHIKKGCSILMYPEGRRTRGPVLDEFRPGSFVMAIHFGLPVVPVAIVEERWAKKPGLFGRKFGHWPGRIKILAGSAIYGDSSLPYEQAVSDLQSRAQQAMRQLITNAF